MLRVTYNDHEAQVYTVDTVLGDVVILTYGRDNHIRTALLSEIRHEWIPVLGDDSHVTWDEFHMHNSVDDMDTDTVKIWKHIEMLTERVRELESQLAKQ